jgi:hypothetical protein
MNASLNVADSETVRRVSQFQHPGNSVPNVRNDGGFKLPSPSQQKMAFNRQNTEHISYSFSTAWHPTDTRDWNLIISTSYFRC